MLMVGRSKSSLIYPCRYQPLQFGNTITACMNLLSLLFLSQSIFSLSLSDYLCIFCAYVCLPIYASIQAIFVIIDLSSHFSCICLSVYIPSFSSASMSACLSMHLFKQFSLSPIYLAILLASVSSSIFLHFF